MIAGTYPHIFADQNTMREINKQFESLAKTPHLVNAACGRCRVLLRILLIVILLSLVTVSLRAGNIMLR